MTEKRLPTVIWTGVVSLIVLSIIGISGTYIASVRATAATEERLKAVENAVIKSVETLETKATKEEVAAAKSGCNQRIDDQNKSIDDKFNLIIKLLNK